MPAAGQAKEEPRPAAIWFVSDFGDHLPPRFTVTGTLARVIHKVLSSVDELGHASSEAVIPKPPGQSPLRSRGLSGQRNQEILY